MKRGINTLFKISLFILLKGLSSANSLTIEKVVDINSSYIEGDRLKEEAYELITAIRSDSTTLCAEYRYGLEKIDPLLQNLIFVDDGKKILNQTLSDMFHSYFRYRMKGCFDPYSIYHDKIYIDQYHYADGESENILLRDLEDALSKYERIVNEGGWKRISKFNGFLKKGDNHSVVKAIKTRLYQSRDYNLTDFDVTLFDFRLEEAVKLFQKRHGLKVDGVVGPNTVSAMNFPIEKVIEKIKINIERLRWLTHSGKDFIAANIPSFKLSLYRDETPILEMRAIVGRKDRPTPMVSDQLTYAVLNPYWRAPKTIVSEDILPKLKAGMFDQLERIGIIASRSGDGNETVNLENVDWSRYDGSDIPFVFMQKPGPMNYLGLVKFMFPNALDIYIHDTPNERLFKHDRRMFSSGCIRIEKPIELFHALLKGENSLGWSYKEIFEYLMKKEEKLVAFSKPLPVYLLYMTVYADREGRLFFYPDIYGYDNIMLQYLFRRKKSVTLHQEVPERESGL